jgi:hypothetical protein
MIPDWMFINSSLGEIMPNIFSVVDLMFVSFIS